MALYGSDVAVDRVNMQLKKIFEPITINKTEFKNRMVVSAMVTNYCNEDGTPTEKFMAYHEHKAKGGYGIIIEDRQIEPWSAFTDRIHKAGAITIAQIYHNSYNNSLGNLIFGVNFCKALSDK